MEKINTIVNWLIDNKTWFLSGLGVTLIFLLIKLLKKIWGFFVNKKGKIKINYTFKQSWSETIFGRTPVFPLYYFEIINAGESEIEIKDVQLYFCGKKINTKFGITDGLTQINCYNSKEYLGSLLPRKTKKGYFEIKAFLPIIANQIKPNSKIQLRVIDSLGNKYYSKKTKYQNFLDNVQLSNEINSKK